MCDTIIKYIIIIIIYLIFLIFYQRVDIIGIRVSPRTNQDIPMCTRAIPNRTKILVGFGILLKILLSAIPYPPSLVRTNVKGERMECNIGQDAIFLTHSEMIYFFYLYL
jgi:hypothetical protein